MKIPPRFLAVAAAASSLFVASSCRLVETPPSETAPDAGLVVPEGFGFSSLASRRVEVRVTTPGGDPYPDASVHLLDSRGRAIETRPTDARGIVAFHAAAPDGSFRLFVNAIGIPSDTLAFSAAEAIVEIPRAFDPPAPSGTNTNLALREMVWSSPTWYSSGLPSGLDTTHRSDITSAFLSDVNFAFPEGVKVPVSHPEYLQQGAAEEILLSDSAEVWLTFLHEGAGYRNSFGYYVLRPGENASSASSLDKRVLFPNASLRGSGGSLVAGDKIRLGSFPRGTRIGFFVVADGWNGSRVDTSGAKPVYYSRSALNPEADESKRQHMAMLLHQGTGKVAMGFEDLNRSSTDCDNDFNDVMFTVSWNPFVAVSPDQFVPLPGRTDSDKDGIADNVDEYPADPTRAFTRWFPAQGSWGTLAFEDLWPRTGDYDFNDMVVRYRVKETRSSNLSVRDIDYVALPMAAGASLRSGLAVKIGVLASMPESVRVGSGSTQRGGMFRRNGSTGESVLHLTRDFLGSFQGESGGLVNTISSNPRLSADTIRARVVFRSAVDLAEPPYDPYLYWSADTTHEIHLPDKAGTASMKRSLLRTKQDRSDTAKGTWYRDSTRLPWGLNLSEEWRWPLEGTTILAAYPSFANWVKSSGRSDLDWYARPVVERLAPLP